MTPGLTPDQVGARLQAAGPGALVHLVGAGGCGMSGLGHLLLDRGFSVSGSDLVLNEEVRVLQARGAWMQRGHHAELVRQRRPVLVAFTPAVRSDNPELEAARALGIPTVRRAVLLAALVHGQPVVAMAGMHGKTTTSALLTFALEQLGARPGCAIGARVPQLNRFARFPEDADPAARRHFVIEADESDGTLPLFHPRHAIFLNVDAEHLDHFAGADDVTRDFERLAAQTSGLRLYCKDDPRLSRLCDGQPRVVSYGFHPQADYRVQPAFGLRSPPGPCTIWCRGSELGEFSTRLLGDANRSNLAAVVAFLHQNGFAPADIARAVAPFRGAARRQEELDAGGDVRVFDDYGHHPTEVRATLRALRELRPRRLLVAFQPHRFTRTRHLMAEFATAFAGADRLWLTEIYAASEAPLPGVSSAALAEAIRARGQPVEAVCELEDLGQAVLQAIQPGDLVLFLGAGNITEVAHEVAARLRSLGANRVAPGAPAMLPVHPA